MTFRINYYIIKNVIKKERDVSTSTWLRKALGKMPRRKQNYNVFMVLKVDILCPLFYILLEVFYIANSKNDLLINEQIKVPQVLVIGPNGEQTGVKSINDALTLAN